MTDSPRRYRTPLPGLLAGLLDMSLNRLLASDERSPERLMNLQGRVLKLELEGLQIDLWFSFSEERVTVGLDNPGDGEPDTAISGTPVGLFSMAIPDESGSWGRPGSPVRISGDAALARDLERLFSRLEPDVDAALSRLLGDVIGHQVASGLRAGADRARETVAESRDMMAEFLAEPDGPVVTESEFREFSEQVSETRDAVDRLEARLRLRSAPEGDAE